MKISKQRESSSFIRKKPKGVRKQNNTENNTGVYEVLTDIDLSDLCLPNEKSKRSIKLSDYALLFYGRQKIGKSTFASMFNNLFIFAFEPGAKNIEAYVSKVITDWRIALKYVDLLESDPDKFEYVCLDTGHYGYDLCLEYVCRRDNIKHPGRMDDYGASWKAVSREFLMFHLRLSTLKKGFVVISHERTKERKDRYGNKFYRIEPCFSDSTSEFYSAIIDLIGYYCLIDNKRYLQILPSDDILCGHKIKHHFRTENGDPIFKIPMGENEEDAFKNFKKAFNNQQRKTYNNLQNTNLIRRKRI